MSPWAAGHLDETATLKKDSIPAILFEDFEVESRPLDVCGFLLGDKLEIYWEGKVKFVGGSSFFFGDEDWRNSLSDRLSIYVLFYRQLNSLSSMDDNSRLSNY